jgi:hypothetical protein
VENQASPDPVLEEPLQGIAEGTSPVEQTPDSDHSHIEHAHFREEDQVNQSHAYESRANQPLVNTGQGYVHSVSSELHNASFALPSPTDTILVDIRLDDIVLSSETVQRLFVM